MKKVTMLCLTILILSCNPSGIKIQDAITCVEGYLNALSNDDLAKADEFYTDNYAESESPDDRMNKMKKLQQVLGPVESYHLTDSVIKETFGEPAQVLLTYKVKHRRKTTEEQYTVINDEGQCKIISQSVSDQ